MASDEADREEIDYSSKKARKARPRWQKIFGIRRRNGRFLKWTLTKWGFFLVVLLVGVGGMAATLEYTMRPEFCQSCHIMEPYYQAWHKSTHKDVPCVKCHFEPGLEGTLKGKWKASRQAIEYLTNTYGSKPHAEIKDVSCLRKECHAKRLIEGKVKWDVPSTRGGTVTIHFDHTPHLEKTRRGIRLRCVSCHSQIVQGQHLVVTLDTCFLCHFKNLERGRHFKGLQQDVPRPGEPSAAGCQACHSAPKDKIRLSTGLFNHGDYVNRGVACVNCHADSVKGNGVAYKQVCWQCHNTTSAIDRYGDTQLLHDEHISKHKVECASCHIQIKHNLSAGGGFSAQPGANRKEMFDSPCAQCHEQTHLGPDSLYRGVGGVGVPPMPSPMFRTQVDCIGCHKKKERSGKVAEVVGQTFLGEQKSCTYCHGEKYQGRLDEWKKTVNEHLATAEAGYAKATLAVQAAKLSDVDVLRVKRLMDNADHDIRLVKLGHGVHNVNYATALLNYAEQCCGQARAIAEGRPVPAMTPIVPATTKPTSLPANHPATGGAK